MEELALPFNLLYTPPQQWLAFEPYTNLIFKPCRTFRAAALGKQIFLVQPSGMISDGLKCLLQ